MEGSARRLIMLELDAVHTFYGDSHVLHGVSMRVGAGEAVALLGRNGAGKTTAIRSIVGFTPPRAGRVVLDGQAIHGWPAHRIARAGVALVPQGRRIFAPLSVRENLLLGARAEGQRAKPVANQTAKPVADQRAKPVAHQTAKPVATWTLDRVFALFPRLRERSLQSGGTLSGGEQQMLAIGRALLTNGRLLVLDEPSEGLAPIVVREIGDVVARLKGERLSILIVEQNYHLALRIADRVYVMSKGQIVFEGTPAELEAREDVKRRYLGVA
jgi:branched-chain amino acid transport system ATP-binding protein